MSRHYILAHNKNTGSREDLREGHNSPFQDFRKHKAGGVIYSSKFSSGFICPLKDVLRLTTFNKGRTTFKVALRLLCFL